MGRNSSNVGQIDSGAKRLQFPTEGLRSHCGIQANKTSGISAEYPGTYLHVIE